jgi:hypothetical protein
VFENILVVEGCMSVQCEIVCGNLISLIDAKKTSTGSMCAYIYASAYICFCVHMLLHTKRVRPMDIAHAQAS